MRRLVPPHIKALAGSERIDESVDGAALILDAEGSTALASRLQPFGTEGAEALADILTDIFSPIVETVVANGGSVAEVAGDGVLAVFPGNPSAAVTRAINTAWKVMTDLKAMSEFTTPDGPASLVFRAAIGAGTLHSLIWWCEDPEASQNAAFTSQGSAVDEARRGEVLTPGGVIALGPVASKLLGHTVKFSDLKEGFSIVEHWKSPSDGDVPRVVGGDEPDLRFFPSTVATADLRGEFRDVVAVFVDVLGEATEGHRSEMAHVLAALARQRGYLNHVIKPNADSHDLRVFALWGAPISREHDVGYALRFLDDLHSKVGLDRTRAGVTRSTAFTGFIGGESQEQYTAIGPGINLAARMCSSASWGEIRVGQEVTARLGEPWLFESVGPVEYRGFAAPVDTYRITYIPPVVAAEPTGDVFIGRARELDHLEDLFASLWSGRTSGVIAVTGSPGIGKSRLTRALEERLAKRKPAPTWIRAQADEIRTQPLSTLRDAMASYFGRPGQGASGERLDQYLEILRGGGASGTVEMDRTRSALGDLLDLAPDVAKAASLEPKVRFENLVMAVENLIGEMARESPVIISVSDGQWLDEGTADILRRLSADLADRSVGVIVETRTTDFALEPDHVLELGPMDDAEIEELVTAALTEDPDEAEVALVADRSGGNPFFALELAEYMRRESGGADDERTSIPFDMRRVLVARLDSLSAPVRRTVQTGSVLGNEVDLEVLDQMTVASGSSWEEAVTNGIWENVDDTHVRFTSSLMRDAAYGMLLHSDARALHSEAAAAIEATADGGRDAELAHHHDKAGNASTAADYYTAAGRSAAEQFDNHDALLHFERALQLLPDDDSVRRYATLILEHNVYELQGLRTSQGEVIGAMESLSGLDRVSTLQILVLRSRLLASLGRYDEADEVAVEGLAEATGLPFGREQGALVFLRAQVARNQGRIPESVALAAEAREIFAGVDEGLDVARVDDFAGGIAWETGDFEAAADLHRSAAAKFADSGRVTDEVRALNNLGTAVFSIGDYSTAREIHRQGAERSREVGYRMGEGDHLDNMGGTAWAVWDLDLAVEYYTAALEIREGMDDWWGIAISKGNLGAANRAMGKPQEGLAFYREALEIDQRIGRLRGEAYDLHGIGLCQLDLGRNNLAVEALERAAEIRDELDEPHLADESNVARAVALKRRGESERAGALVEAALTREGEVFFAASMETTASRLRCIEVLQELSPKRAEEVRERTREDVAQRAERISDPEHRRSYLDRAEAMFRSLEGA